MDQVPYPTNFLLHFYASASVRVLARLNNPYILSVFISLAVELLLLVVLLKAIVLWVALTLLDVES